MSDFSDKAIPIAKSFSIKELPGWLGKQIDIPPGRQGILILDSHPARLLPAGRHAALSSMERLSGRGAQLLAGYVPAQPFTAFLKVTSLLSGDEELMDASLVCQVEVTDPSRFFMEVVLPQGVIDESSVELSDPQFNDALAAYVCHYEAADLVNGLPTSRLVGEIQSQLAPALARDGLQLIGFEMLSFRRTADQLKIAHKAQELEARLRQVSLEGKMAEMEDQAKLNDFTRQMQSELGDDAGIRQVEQAANVPSPVSRVPLIARVRSKLAALKPPTEGERRWRLGRLFHRAGATEEPHPGRHQMRQWLIGRGIMMLVLILAGYFITALIMSGSQEPSWSIRWEFLLIIWGPILAVLVQSLISFMKKREEIAEALWTTKGTTFIDDLSRNNRQRTDQLVRDQCAGDLKFIFETLNDVRSRVYRAGDENRAMQIKQLEGKVESYRAEVINPSFGTPPYLSDLKIDRHIWGHLLDYDEKLLVTIAGARMAAGNIQQKLSPDGCSADDINHLESRIDTFRRDFSLRQNAVKVSEQDLQRAD